MSDSGFNQSDYIITENQRSLVSGEAYYYNPHFESLDGVDYSIIFNQHTEYAYLYVSNDLYESVMFLPDHLLDILWDIALGRISSHLKITGLQTTVDWLVNNEWQYASDLQMNLTLKEVDGVQYTVLGSDYVNSVVDRTCVFKVFDLYFTNAEIEKIILRLQHIGEQEISNTPTRKLVPLEM